MGAMFNAFMDPMYPDAQGKLPLLLHSLGSPDPGIVVKIMYRTFKHLVYMYKFLISFVSRRLLNILHIYVQSFLMPHFVFSRSTISFFKTCIQGRLKIIRAI